MPKDLPVTAHLSAVAGAQPKIGLIEEGGKFYAPGTSPSEVITAFRMCDDLASQMIPYCQRKLSSFDGDKEATVKAVLKGLLLAKRWCTDQQCVWIMSASTIQSGCNQSGHNLRRMYGDDKNPGYRHE